MNTSYTTPRGEAAIVREAIDIHATEVFTQWRKAAFVVMGRTKYGSLRSFEKALAKQNSGKTMPGFSRTIMNGYAKRWDDHPDTPKQIGEGETVEFPSGDDWKPMSQIGVTPRAIDMSLSSHVEEVARQIKNSPEVMANITMAATPSNLSDRIEHCLREARILAEKANGVETSCLEEYIRLQNAMDQHI